MTSTATEKRMGAVGDSGAASGKAGMLRERAASPEGPPAPSFAAFIADLHFVGELCVALSAPLVMLGSIARSLDPRVGGGQGQAAAGSGAADPPPALTCTGPLPWEALDDFPFGANAAVQALHVARHLVWYALVRPARIGDWAGLLLNVMNMVYPCTLLLVAMSSRTGRVWAWWRRHRSTYVCAVVVLSRCVLLVCTFLLLPPAAWPTHTLAGYVVSASRRPLANALALSVYDQLVKVPLLASPVQALTQTVAVFVLAYLVAPTIVTVQQQQRQQDVSPGSGANSACIAPVPLQCGLRPEHSALLPCRPLALQVLLGLAMVAWPVWLSWAVERRLRMQHAELCRDRGRSQPWARGVQRLGWREMQQQVPEAEQPASHDWPACGRVAAADAAVHLPAPHQRGSRGEPVQEAQVQSSRSNTAAAAAAAAAVPAAAPGVRPDGSRPEAPRGATAASAPGARYRSSRRIALASVKVLEHPGSFEEYGNHLASVLHDAVREQLAAAAAAGAAAAEPAGPESVAPDGPGYPPEGSMQPRVTPATPAAAAAEPVLHTAVIRGCVQAVLWGWVPEGAVGGGAEGDAVAAQRLLQRLPGRLVAPGLVVGGAGGVRGVSVQVGQAVAMAQDTILGGGDLQQEGREKQEAEKPHADGAGVACVRWSCSSGNSGAARLLKMDPPAASLPAAAEAASGPLAVRLLLHSPAPQPARVLVLAERQGRGGVVPPRAVLLREVAVALEGGVQEVEVELEAGELAGAVEGGGLSGGVGVLRVMMVAPVHVSQGAESGQPKGPHPPPLVHWVAPPLLLLPEEAAGELRGLWEEMKREQQEEGEEQQQGQEQVGQAAPTSSVQNVVAYAGPAEALAGVEQESFLWWSHMAPLLEDLAYALADSAGQGAERESVLLQLLTFLRDSGMQHTGAMLQQRSLALPVTLHAALPSHRHLSTLTHRLLLPIAPYSPPALELSYQSWRLAGLTAAAPYMLLATAQPFLLALAKTVAQDGVPEALAMAPLAALDWVSDSACSLVLLRLTAIHVGGSLCESESSVNVAIRRHALTGVVFGPVLLLAASLGLLPYFDSFVGDDRAVLLACLHRALLLPSLQRLPVRHVLAASPLLAAGEALQLAALQPAWGWRRVAGHVAAWRLVAAAVAAAWECRSRRRFAALVAVRREREAGGGLSAAASGGCYGVKYV